MGEVIDIKNLASKVEAFNIPQVRACKEKGNELLGKIDALLFSSQRRN